jgi:hypothetical protein
MRGINNKKGQSASMMSIMFGVVLAVITIQLALSMMPDLSNAIYGARNQDGLNCASDSGKFDVNGVPMYNSSRPTGGGSALGCTVLGVLLPYLLIGIIVAVVGALMAGKLFGGQTGGQAVESYPQYPN